MKHLPTTRWILTAGAVVALVLLSASGPAFADARLGTQVVPTRQAITLTIDAAQLPYTGTTQIDLNVTEAVSAFTLHAEDMEITELTLENNGRPVEASFTLG
ncbi:MAG TPA: hypothetical protein VLB27_10235, partial [candidate division Zixibacteria bacterium]|nr:hypothetical protein [candidate division Zixibacteria bacterium]